MIHDINHALCWMTKVTATAPILKQYDYRPRKLQVIVLFLLASTGVAISVYFASTHQGPFDAKGLRLTQVQSRILFGVAAGICSLSVPLLGSMVYVAFAYDRRIALTADYLILPRPTRMGLSRDEIQIPFDQVLLVSVHKFIGPTMLLRLDYLGGVVSVPSNMISRRAEFDQLCRDVEDAVARAATDQTI